MEVVVAVVLVAVLPVVAADVDRVAAEVAVVEAVAVALLPQALN